MKKIAYAAFASAAALALAACGGSETPTDTATDSVETLPEETTAADPMATDSAMAEEATGAASDAAM